MRDDFLSAAERSFLGVLRQAVGERYAILAKVRLADVLYVPRATDGWQSFQNKIDRKHLDFVLCDPGTMQPVAGVELDDASHARPDRRERDEFVDEACGTAGLPLIRVSARRQYALREIAELVEREIGDGVRPAFESNVGSSEAPQCPRCGGTMVARVARRGADRGGSFYGCADFPRCKGTMPIDDPAT